ncbi:MAG: RNA-binding protein [Candidatus Bathyarchaeota archaeon B63]|nr:MAG: RNA-binding protein [Candidatus Bathyarchaeota archaeon B63]
MPKIVKRFFMKKRGARRLLGGVSESLGFDAERLFGPKPQVEVLETEKCRIYLINGSPILAASGDMVFPTLFFKEQLSRLPRVIVDMGAVPYICRGADVMAPGIVEIDGDFGEGDLVIVLDERNRRPIAVAQSLLGSEGARMAKKGRVLKNLHYVGDEIWGLMKDMASS